MKNNEFAVMAVASLLLLGFVVYMLLQSFDMSKADIIHEHLKNDSIIMKQNQDLKVSDSLFKLNVIHLENKLDVHENKIRSLENRKPLVRKDTVFLIN
jgi:hypothetical protein